MSKARQKGTSAETAVVEYLRERGFKWAERRALHGAVDKGDINLGDPSVVLEVKRCEKFLPGEWIKELEAEKHNARAGIGAVWFWRRGKGSPGDWYVLMSGEDLVTLLRAHCGFPA